MLQPLEELPVYPYVFGGGQLKNKHCLPPGYVRRHLSTIRPLELVLLRWPPNCQMHQPLFGALLDSCCIQFTWLFPFSSSWALLVPLCSYFSLSSLTGIWQTLLCFRGSCSPSRPVPVAFTPFLQVLPSTPLLLGNLFSARYFTPCIALTPNSGSAAHTSFRTPHRIPLLPVNITRILDFLQTQHVPNSTRQLLLNPLPLWHFF